MDSFLDPKNCNCTLCTSERLVLSIVKEALTFRARDLRGGAARGCRSLRAQQVAEAAAAWCWGARIARGSKVRRGASDNAEG